MHFSMKIVPYLFLLNSHYSQAIPIAQGGAIATPCVINTGDRKTYTVTEETDVEGAPQQLAFSCGPSGSTTCSVGKSVTFSVAVTVTVGVELGLDYEGITAGVQTSVSTTTENGTAEQAEIQCPGPWSCGILMIPTLHQVSGEQTTTSSGCDAGSPRKAPYTVQFPLLVDDAPKTFFEGCACPNKPGSTAEGAPKLCPEDC